MSLETMAREALEIESGFIHMDKFRKIAQGYLDLLAQNRRLNDKIDEERLDSCPQLDENPNAHPNITKKGIAVMYGKLHFSMLSSMEAYFVSANDVEELLAQISQLKSENKALIGLRQGDIVSFHNVIEKLQSDNAKLVEALEFYADDGKYHIIEEILSEKLDGFELYDDQGAKARAALAEVENG